MEVIYAEHIISAQVYIKLHIKSHFNLVSNSRQVITILVICRIYDLWP